MPQQSQSTSNNQASKISHTKNSGEEQGGWVVEPMEVEENDPIQDEVHEEPNNESTL